MKTLSKKQHAYGNRMLRLLIFFSVFISWISASTHADINIQIETNSSAAFNGTISGNTTPVLKGGGTLLLTAENTYTSGQTVVENSTLILAHDKAIPTGTTITLKDGATFINMGSLGDEEELQGGMSQSDITLCHTIENTGNNLTRLVGLMDVLLSMGKTSNKSEFDLRLEYSFYQAQAQQHIQTLQLLNQRAYATNNQMASDRARKILQINVPYASRVYVMSPSAVGNATIQAASGTVLMLGSGAYNNNLTEF